jgi:hypothetical protein
MKQNMGSTDRIIRAIAGLVLLALYFLLPLSGVVGTLALVLAAILLVTAAIAFCPLYVPFKFNTRRM